MAFSFFKKAPTAKWPAAPPEGIEAFKKFYDADTLEEVLDSFHLVCDSAKLERGGRYKEFFPFLRAAYQDVLPYKYKEIFKILDKKANQKLYGGNSLNSERNRVLVVGAGPVGLRTAVEAQLLGAKTVLIERRPKFTRNNVLKLWKFLVQDLKSLGAKKFFGKFSIGSINHVNIRTLQIILTKVCCMLGVIIYAPCAFLGITEPVLEEEGSLIAGWKAKYGQENQEAESFVFDVIIGASGKNCVIDGFSRYSLDAKLAIAITANFVNKWTHEENEVEEIGGLGRQYDQDFFKEMHEETGVDLENIVYYKDEVHYFVMTAKKESLLATGVLMENIPDDDGPNGRGKILHPSNIDKEKLMDYAKKAALFSTERKSRKLPHTEWSMLPRGPNGTPDVCIFDFTNLYAARVAARVTVRRGQPLLAAIVGDSLLEPFWPEGTGCARGFLSAMDAGWMIRDWFIGKKNPLKILAEREMTRSILNQTTDGNVQQSFKDYTIDPTTRYKVIPKKFDKIRITNYYDSDNPEEVSFLDERFKEKKFFDNSEHKGILKKFRAKFKKAKREEPVAA
eukprot:GFUD01006567.1.p1 GENE.GFUD01006567.1~~GFUD01006567.1.p1  ORF type:complete len:564 (-),score=170.18 GFUD01006567.1:189-1880(-)